MGVYEQTIYWYVRNDEDGQLNYKLPKTYAKCVNLDFDKRQDVLKYL